MGHKDFPNKTHIHIHMFFQHKYVCLYECNNFHLQEQKHVVYSDKFFFVVLFFECFYGRLAGFIIRVVVAVVVSFP